MRGDAADFRFDKPFDAVFSNATFHWVRPPEAAARCVRDALRPGGRFVAEFGGRGNVRGILAALGTAAGRLGVTLVPPAWYFPGLAEYATLLEGVGLEVTYATLFDRPTPLEGEEGLRDWLAMFARSTLDAVPAARREEFLRKTEKAARPALSTEGGWMADYRRLRVVAVRGD